jgi:rhomboid protease GluP
LSKGINVQSLFTPLGAKENYLILSGEYWRFLTPIFLHADFQHLAMNCLSLFVFGKIIEGMYGHIKFAFIYFVAGIIGNIASFMFSPHSAVGASGAIFGLMGALLYFRVENPIAFKKYFGNNILVMVIVNLVYGFVKPGIDNFGHIGGLVGGFFISGVLKIRKAPNKFLGRTVFIVVTILLLAASLYYGFNLSGNAKYYQLGNLIQENKLFEAEKKGEEIIDMKILDRDLQINVLFRVAMLEYLQGKYDEATQRATYLKEIDPSRGHYLFGIIYLYDGKYDLAEEELKTSVRINPNLREEVDVYLQHLDKLIEQEY